MTMFFKRKEWRAAPWRERMQAVQRKYARRLADWLNQKIALVPVGTMRMYVLVALFVLTVFKGGMLVHVIRQHRAWSVAPSLTRWEFRSTLPIKGRVLDEKLYDSLKKERPGLADSLKILESIY